MAFWHEIPLLRFFLAFIAGVLIACVINTLIALPPLIYFIPGSVFSAYLLYPKKFITYGSRWILGLSVYLLSAMLGYDVSIQKDTRSSPNWFGRLKPTEHNSIYQVMLEEEPIRKGKYLNAKAKVEKVFFNNKELKVSGKGLVYLQAAITDSLAYGDRLLVKGQWREPPEALNPGSFNYRSYLFFKHIHHIIYVKTGQWRISARNQGKPVIALAKKWQNKLVDIYRGNAMGEDELAVGSAMILGKYEDFSDELRNSYSAAGVTHILSVSGLHVGIVFVVFNHLLFFLNRRQTTRIIKGILMISITWFYALLTGLSPPVMRAAAMFTFLIAGEMRKRKSNILNTLASSALLLMLTDPFLVADIGFELSYLAVAGIVLAGNPLYQLITPRNYLADKIWQLVAISIGAQLFTGPLAVYHFMQFPLYFIPANIMIIPLSTLVMYAGMAVLVAEPVPLISTFINWVFNESLHFMNTLIAWIEKWPYASLKGLYLSGAETLILFGLSVIICMAIHQKGKHIIVFILIIISLFCMSSGIRKSFAYSREELCIWSQRKGLAAGFVNGREITVYDSGTDDVQLEKQILRHLKSMAIHEITKKHLKISPENVNDSILPSAKVLKWQGKRLVLLKGGTCRIREIKPLSSEILVISCLRYKEATLSLQQLNPELLILCQDISTRTAKLLRNTCKEKGISFYDIREDGAFLWSEYKSER